VKVRWGSASAENGQRALVHMEDGRRHLRELLGAKLILEQRALCHVKIGTSKVWSQESGESEPLGGEFPSPLTGFAGDVPQP